MEVRIQVYAIFILQEWMLALHQGMCSLSHAGVCPVQSPIFIGRNAELGTLSLSVSHLPRFMAWLVVFAQSDIALSHVSYPCPSFTSTFSFQDTFCSANSTYLLIITSVEPVLLVIDLMNRVPTLVKYHSRPWR